jgi:Cu(I)/Ag(I) efflux system periplasmic protein CusF
MEIRMKAMHILAAAAVLLASAAGAQTPQSGDHASHHPAAPGAASTQSDGEVRKVDLALGKVTLRHGPLANLDMPAMTMVFTAVDPKMLEGLKQGDKVRFTADKKNGTYVVTAIEAAR